MESATKSCPFCAEDIAEKAIKCKHCGGDLTEPKKVSASGRRVCFSLALAAFGISGLNFAEAVPGSSAETEGYILMVLSVVLLIAGICIGTVQSKRPGNPSDKKFWAISIPIFIVVMFVLLGTT